MGRWRSGTGGRLVVGILAGLLLAACTPDPVAVRAESPVPLHAFSRPATDDDELPGQFLSDLRGAPTVAVRRVEELDGRAFHLALTAQELCLFMGTDRIVRFHGTSSCVPHEVVGTHGVAFVDGTGIGAVVVPSTCTADFPDQTVVRLEDVHVVRGSALHAAVTCADGSSFRIDL